MVMKDKLYKSNRKKRYFVFKRIAVCVTAILTSTIILAIPLSIYLIAKNEQSNLPIQQVQTETPEVNEDEEVEIVFDR